MSRGWGAPQWAVVGVVLVAWALRLLPLLNTPLHPDEALYGYWGLLIGRGRDPWLVGGTVYKPPLLPYLVALSQALLGDTTIALRFPGLVAGLVCVPLVGVLAQALYREAGLGVSAGTAVALSPFGVVFSGTAFPDPIMVVLGVAGCVAAARGWMRWAGLLVGLSFVTKQTGVVWWPLVMGIALAQGLRSGDAVRELAACCLVPTLMAFAWDRVRVAQGGDSFWSAGVVGYGGLRLIWSHELWPRLRAWVGLMRSLFLSTPVNGLVLMGMLMLVWDGLCRHPRTLDGFLDQLLVSFCLVYALLHWLIAFPVWDRYLLPLLPILAVLLGRILMYAALRWRRHVARSVGGMVGAVLLGLLLLVPAFRGSTGRSSLGAERANYQGIEDVLALFKELPEGAVVYHHWLGWHYHYALFDGPAYLAYWPTPGWLARDVQAFGKGDPRYIAFPAWESTVRVEQALQEVGYVLEPVLKAVGRDDSHGFTAYRVLPTLAR